MNTVTRPSSKPRYALRVKWPPEDTEDGAATDMPPVISPQHPIPRYGASLIRFKSLLNLSRYPRQVCVPCNFKTMQARV